MLNELNKILQLDREKDSIAIVGNAKSLFGKGLGEEIDRHTFVMRLNYGAILDEVQQGSRTDLYGCSDDKLTLSWIEEKFRPKLVIWLTNKLVPGHFFGHSEINYIINKQEYWEIAYNYVQPFRPSSGAIAVVLLREVYGIKNIHLYGFDFFSSPTFYHKKKWHFWKKRKPVPHNGNLELEMMKKLGVTIH